MTAKQFEREPSATARFPGLVYNQQGEPASVVRVGDADHYAIPAGDFWRHVEAPVVDEAVIEDLIQRIGPMREEMVHGMLTLMGKDDLFTKAALEASVRNLGQLIREGDPQEWVPWLKMAGFRIIVDVHGKVIEINYPEGEVE